MLLQGKIETATKADEKIVLHSTRRLTELLQKFESTCLNCIVISKSLRSFSSQLGLSLLLVRAEIGALKEPGSITLKAKQAQHSELVKAQAVLDEVAVAANKSAAHFKAVLEKYRILVSNERPKERSFQLEKAFLHELIEVTHGILHHETFYKPAKSGSQSTLVRSLSSLRIHMNAKSDFMKVLVPIIKALSQESREDISSVIRTTYLVHSKSAVAFKSAPTPRVNFDPATYLQSVLGDVTMFFTRVRDCVAEINKKLPELKERVLSAEAAKMLEGLPEYTNALGAYANTLSTFKCQRGLSVFIGEKAENVKVKEALELALQERKADAARKAEAAKRQENEEKRKQKLTLSEHQLELRQAEREAARLRKQLAEAKQLISQRSDSETSSRSSFSASDAEPLSPVHKAPTNQVVVESPVGLSVKVSNTVKTALNVATLAGSVLYQNLPTLWWAPTVDPVSKPPDSIDYPEEENSAAFYHGETLSFYGNHIEGGTGRVASLRAHFDQPDPSASDSGTGLRRRK